MLIMSVAWARAARADSVTLSWNPNPEPSVTGYVVSYGTRSQSYTATVSVGVVTTATINQLSAGQTYYFSVQARNQYGLSGYASEVSTTLPTQAPPPPPAAAPPPPLTIQTGTRPPNDVNGDGWADLIWQNSQNGQVSTWFMLGAQAVGTSMLNPSQVPDTNWKIVGRGDMNRDGRP